jgi:hypothetical protein
MEGVEMATWSLCTKVGSEQQKQSIFINLDSMVTIERLGNRTSVTFVNGGTEILATAPEDVIQPDRG